MGEQGFHAAVDMGAYGQAGFLFVFTGESDEDSLVILLGEGCEILFSCDPIHGQAVPEMGEEELELLAAGGFPNCQMESLVGVVDPFRVVLQNGRLALAVCLPQFV